MYQRQDPTLTTQHVASREARLAHKASKIDNANAHGKPQPDPETAAAPLGTEKAPPISDVQLASGKFAQKKLSGKKKRKSRKKDQRPRRPYPLEYMRVTFMALVILAETARLFFLFVAAGRLTTSDWQHYVGYNFWPLAMLEWGLIAWHADHRDYLVGLEEWKELRRLKDMPTAAPVS